jgi:hypothetical protein
MSQILIQHYLNQLADLRKASGTNREMVVREAFKEGVVDDDSSRSKSSRRMRCLGSTKNLFRLEIAAAVDSCRRSGAVAPRSSSNLE